MFASKEKAREYHKQWYQRNKEKRLVINKRYKVKLQTQYRIDKESHPCTDCNMFYPSYVMQYDHLHSKKVNVGTIARNTSGKQLREEIAKCELVCANCHAIRTHNRRTSIASDAPAL